MERSERIAEAVAQSGKQKNVIAAECGVEPASITQWTKGNTKNLRLENLFNLAKATGYSAKWLAIEEGPKFESEEQPGMVSDSKAKYSHYQSSYTSTLVQRLSRIDQNGALSKSLATAINAVLDVATHAQPAQPSIGRLSNLPSLPTGIEDDPQLTDLGEHLNNALAALDQFRQRKTVPTTSAMGAGETDNASPKSSSKKA